MLLQQRRIILRNEENYKEPNREISRSIRKDLRNTRLIMDTIEDNKNMKVLKSKFSCSVLCYIQNSIEFRFINNYVKEEITWVCGFEVDGVLLMGLYGSHGSSTPDFLQQLEECMEYMIAGEMNDIGDKKLCIVGDFNIDYKINSTYQNRIINLM
ncbi:hypothetical protein HHI36_011372, partial [Cryptolaemus montrouzieri]